VERTAKIKVRIVRPKAIFQLNLSQQTAARQAFIFTRARA
jgi:hypothetical protein